MYKEKSEKYKSKYLNLKKKLYGGYNFEEQYMTSNINSLPKDKKNFYLKQNLFSYWISSSHNTYLPFNQNRGENSLCYYNLQYMTYFGGCVEIDTFSVENQDVMISHLITNKKKIKLTDILKIVMEALISKIEKNIVSGPFILNFDNSGLFNYLNTKEKQKVFWDNIYSSLLDTKNPNVEKYRKKIEQQFPVLFINKDFDLSKYSLEDMNFKILFRWGANKKCKDKKKDETVGHELCSPKDTYTDPDKLTSFTSSFYEDTITGEEIGKEIGKEIQWVHLDKTKGILKKFTELKNMSESISSPLINEGFTDINIFSIINSQRNLLRMYPHLSYTSSGNYHNMKYFRDGVQITALNLQTIDNSRLLNDAVFIPPKFNYCTLKYIKENKCIDQELILSYRLKPLWLLGLIPYPNLYNLEINIINDGIHKLNSDLKFIYGLDNKIYASGKEKIILKNIDVTVPFFIVEYKYLIRKYKYLTGNIEYKNGIDIIWTKSKLENNELNFYIYELKKDGNFNDVTIKDNCENDSLLNIKNKIEIKIKYNWTSSIGDKYNIHNDNIKKYNKKIIETRTNFINEKNMIYKTIEILNKKDLLLDYQNKLFTAMNTAS
jgi:hypothetical protein